MICLPFSREKLRDEKSIILNILQQINESLAKLSQCLHHEHIGLCIYVKRWKIQGQGPRITDSQSCLKSHLVHTVVYLFFIISYAMTTF